MLVILVSDNQDPRSRTLELLADPKQWHFWPFLPLIRRRPGSGEELGVVYDALHASNLPGFSCTVFLTNLFLLPTSERELLALPREMFDTPEELLAADWMVN